MNRGSYRYAVDLTARVHTADHDHHPVAVTAARVVDLSRTGAGLVLTVPSSFEMAFGRPIRLAVDDAMNGHPIVRQWLGRVTHAHDHDRDGLRLGVLFATGRPRADAGDIPPVRTPAPACASWPPSPLLSDAFPTPLPSLFWPFERLGIPSPSHAASASALLGLAADQASKAWAWSGPGGVFDLVPGLLAVAPVENPGALASLAGGLPLTAPLCALSALALAALAHRRTPSRAGARPCQSTAASLGAGLLAAGVLGNSADRLALGYVRDFLVSGLAPHWAFNLADLFLVLGALTVAAARLAPTPKGITSE